MLTATNGKRVESQVVFVAVLEHIRDLAKKMMRKKKIKGIKSKDIQWIITVPAIWNEAAKIKMETWTIESGLVDEQIENQCHIAYEPVCAALSIQHEVKDGLSRGDKYILVDAGG